MPADPSNLPFSISLRRVNQGVGWVALLLPLSLLLVTLMTNTCFNTSISHYYFSRIGGDLFVGGLCFIGLQLTFFYSFKGSENVEGYREHRPIDNWVARLAGVCAFAIAFSPTTGSGCNYDGTEVARVFITGANASELFPPFPSPVTGTITYDFWASFGLPQKVAIILNLVHLTAAAVMFAVLGYFSFFVFTRKNSSTSLDAESLSSRKHRRNLWYKVLGVAIFAAVLAIGVKSAAVGWILSEPIGARFQLYWDDLRLTFVLEAIALMSFGLSWMIKGRFFDWFEDEAVLQAR